MPNNNEVIMTQKQFEEMQAKLAELKQELIFLTQSEARIAEFHGYNSFSSGDIRVKKNAIDYYVDILSRAVIQEIQTEDHMVGLGDIISINIIGTKTKQEIVKLVSNMEIAHQETIDIEGTPYQVKVISTLSPIGNAIHNHTIGETVSYEANGHQFSVEIIQKLTQAKEESLTR